MVLYGLIIKLIIYKFVAARRLSSLTNQFADTLEHPGAVSVVRSADFYTQEQLYPRTKDPSLYHCCQKIIFQLPMCMWFRNLGVFLEVHVLSLFYQQILKKVKINPDHKKIPAVTLYMSPVCDGGA